MKKRLFALATAMAMALMSLFVTTAYAYDINTMPEVSNTTSERIALLTEQKLNTLGADLIVDNVQLIEDFSGNEYALVECSPIGYFIYHIDSGVCVEYNINAQSPFINSEGEVLYGGPTYYYEEADGEYVHTILDSTLDTEALTDLAEQCNDWNIELLTFADDDSAKYIQGISDDLPAEINRTGTNYWVTSKSFFTSATSGFGYKSGGYCGYIAANLVLKYWDYRGTIDLPSYSSTTGLTNALIKIGEDDYGSSTWAASISSIMNTYCANNSLPEKASWAVGVYNVTSEIDNKRPVILFGNLDNYSAGNHAVVVYGYNTYENDGYYTFRCHFGWNSTTNNDYTDVHVSGATGSIFGSNTKYKP